MRLKNEKMILSLIRKGGVSRASIAKQTGLTKAAVSIIVDELIKREIVFEHTAKAEGVGRAPVRLSLNDGAVYAVGVNITRRHITVGITDLGGRIVTEETFAVLPPTEAVDRIAASLQRQLETNKIEKSKLYQLSAVTPGPVDSACGVVLNPPNFTAWHGFPVAEALARATALPTVLHNVSSAVAVAEQYFGAAQGTEDFLALLVNEGIGSGVVLHGELFDGACELGHTSIAYDGALCECGNRGCLEQYAAIPRVLQGTPYATWRDAVDAEDEAVLAREASYLATAIVSAHNIFGLKSVVLCGAVTYRAERIIALLHRQIERNTLAEKGLSLCASRVGSPLVIAASMAVRGFFRAEDGAPI